MLSVARMRWLISSAVVGTVAIVAVSCGSGDGSNSSEGGNVAGCTPGRVEECPCPGGGKGVQQCLADGTFGACDCGPGGSGGSGGAGGGDTTSSGKGSSGSGGDTTGAGGAGDCGNAVKDPGEECDDGNNVDDDTCTNACKLPICGDGIKQAGEDCDDGNVAEFDQCPANCKLCGNGKLDPGEDCDDGNLMDGDACPATCKFCGDGVTNNGEECDDGNDVETDGCTSLCKLPACGDGFTQPGEDCDDGNTMDGDVCPANCKLGGDIPDAGPDLDASDASDAPNCDDVVTYAGMIPNVASVWSYQGLKSLEAGNEMCKTIGADHFCDYEEVKLAEAKGELANIAAGTTAWIHRTTMAVVNGQNSAPGPGGRCNEWTYGTNHISDGEYVSFDQVGKPTYHLDNDTFFDGVDTTHAIPNQLQCGGQLRAILCCYPKCAP